MGTACCGIFDDDEAKGKLNMESIQSNSKRDDDTKNNSSKLDCGSSKISLKSRMIYSPPILTRDGNQVILLYTKKQTTKYNILNLDSYKLSDEVEVKCNEDFNVYNTVYALNEIVYISSKIMKNYP